MIVISTLLNSCVVVLTSSPRAVSFCACWSCALSNSICDSSCAIRSFGSVIVAYLPTRELTCAANFTTAGLKVPPYRNAGRLRVLPEPVVLTYCRVNI